MLNKPKKESYKDESSDDNEIKEIRIALDNVKNGRVKPIERVAKDLNISLNVNESNYCFKNWI